MTDTQAAALQDFAGALRRLRRYAGDPPYRVLARRTGYAATTLSAAASGRTVPTRSVTLAYVAACGGDPAEWERRWQALRSPRRVASTPASAHQVPRQLPFDVYGFTGRSAELDRLDAVVDPGAGEAGSAVVISAISGTAGVGKTALAVHWAHRVADRFPDGQLYVDLRGYSADQPVSPDDALGGFLRALGVEDAAVPPSLAERAARYRTLLAGRRLLVMLDNAYTVEQIRPLLPGSGSCLVVVTSRDDLAGLVARDGARRIDLDLLGPDEGLALLRTLAGDRVSSEPGAAAELAGYCAGLPLTLRIAAEMAVARPATSLTDLVAELADERGRLDALESGGDERTAVRAVFSWSYRRLPEPVARMFRLLGLHPGADVDGYAAAALAGADLPATRRLLDKLVRARLIREDTPDRYRMHDLLRAYAAERAEEESEAERRAALTRLLHYYHATAAQAIGFLFPAEQRQRARPPTPAGPAPVLDSTASVQEWLESERANLVEAVGHAARHGWPTFAGYLPRVLWRYLDFGAHYEDAHRMYRYALEAALEHADQLGEAFARLGLGHASYRFNRYEEAAGHYRHAAQLFGSLGDSQRQNTAVTNLGMVYTQWGRYADALDCYERAIAAAVAVGDRGGEALALAWAGLEQGRLARYDEGIASLRRALAYFHELGFPMRESEVITDLGMVHLWAGRLDEASDLLQQAFDIGERTGDRNRQLEVLNALGEVHFVGGRLDEARASHESALALSLEIGQRDEQARALAGIGAVAHARGDLQEARERWQESHVLYAALKMPKADEVRAQLDALDNA